MRRKDREIPEAEALQLLNNCEYGILSCVCGSEPYSVPVNYVYNSGDNAIFVHCATEGKKLDCIAENQNVQFVVVGKAEIAKGFTTRYESAIAEGTAGLVENDDEKRRALLELCEKLYPDTKTDTNKLEGTLKYIEKYLEKTAIIKISIKNISGKANK